MRKIFIVTERRADYSRFKPILRLLHDDDDFDYDLVVTGLHLMEDHGYTLNEITNDGFKVFSTFEMFQESEDTGASMIRAYAEAVKQISYALEKSKPDIILSGFDIAANAAVTIAGAHMNIPVAHIQGGEVTGTIDESIRHAMSKFAHYHFAANEDACERLIKMGEHADHVFNVGCPSIDALLEVEDDQTAIERYELSAPFFLMIQHPVTTELNEAGKQIRVSLKALKAVNEDVLIIMPNNDAGYSAIIRNIENSNIKHVDTLPIRDYVNLLKRSSGLIGNSSSGIHEAATFNVPVVNIGSRQQGRLRPKNVIDVGHDVSEIVNAMSRCIELKQQQISFENPYGDGESAARIVAIMSDLKIDSSVIQKRNSY